MAKETNISVEKAVGAAAIELWRKNREQAGLQVDVNPHGTVENRNKLKEIRESLSDITDEEILALAALTWTKMGKKLHSSEKTWITIVPSRESTGTTIFNGEMSLLSKMRQAQIAKDCGLWPDNNHLFELTEKPLVINKQQMRQILDIGDSLFGTGGVLDGLVMLHRDLCQTNQKPSNNLLRLFADSIKHKERSINNFGNQPALLARVDLMIDTDGNIKIAEIEAAGKIHGLGFGLFTELIADVPNPNTLGIMHGMTKLIRSNGKDNIKLLVSSRFFLPEIELVSRKLQLENINSQVIFCDPRSGDQPDPKNTTLFNLPQNSPRHLLDSWGKGNLDCLLPPRPILGTKASLAVLFNSESDQEAEEKLLSHIDPIKLASIRRFIPATSIFNPDDPNATSMQNTIIKTIGDSGAKGIALGNNSSKLLKMAKEKNEPIVVSKFIKQDQKDGLFARLAAFFSPDGLITMPITLSNNPIVHGGPKNIQTAFSVI